jgi:hypothetical protein
MSQKKLEDMSVEELLEEEEFAHEAEIMYTQINDDHYSRQAANAQIETAKELEKRGICRGGLNDGCEICVQSS